VRGSILPARSQQQTSFCYIYMEIEKSICCSGTQIILLQSGWVLFLENQHRPLADGYMAKTMV
jgi:hypothetical protein